MSTLAMLDTIIGLVFIYVMYSVICSAIVEWFSSIIALRPMVLEGAVKKLLGPSLSTDFDAHPMIAGLKQKRLLRCKYPDYIAPETFALAFMDVTMQFTPGTPATPGTVTVREPLENQNGQARVNRRARTLAETLTQGTANVGPVQARVERWFADVMESATGSYKRWAQVLVIFTAVFIAWKFDVDSIVIIRNLYHNAPLRASFVSAAQTLAQSDSATIANIPWLQLPIGKDKTSFPGYAMTVIALSFGAPFWFDILKKLINLRQSGTPPDEKPSDKSGPR